MLKHLEVGVGDYKQGSGVGQTGLQILVQHVTLGTFLHSLGLFLI